MPRYPWYTTLVASPKRDFRHFWPFSWAILHVFWVPGGFRCLVTTATRLYSHRQNSLFRAFLAIFVGYSPHFWVPVGLRCHVTPGTRFERHRQNSSFQAFLADFVGYSLRFLGPGRISMPRDPWYMTLVASSKHVISGTFCRFRGLQSTVSGSREDFDAP